MQPVQCTFCGNAADTVEHVLPKWLQHHFGLLNKRFRLWNGSSMPYRQAVIPACKNCNSARLSPLEDRVRRRVATPQDYYIWALKVSFGLAVKDASVPLVRSKPHLGALNPLETDADFAGFIPHAFHALDASDFCFHPKPFGSVLILTTESDEFAMVNVPRPYRGFGIALPSRMALLVLFADRGVISHWVNRDERIRELMQATMAGVPPQLHLATRMFALLRLQNHLRIPADVTCSSAGVVSASVPRTLRVRRQRMEYYRELVRYLGLSDKLAAIAFEHDRLTLGAQSKVKWS